MNLESSATSNNAYVANNTRRPIINKPKNPKIGPTILTANGNDNIPIATNDQNVLNIVSTIDFYDVFVIHWLNEYSDLSYIEKSKSTLVILSNIFLLFIYLFSTLLIK